jgi:hypothetical protein
MGKLIAVWNTETTIVNFSTKQPRHSFHFKYFIDKSIGLDNRLCLYKSSPTTRWNNLNTIYIRHRAIYPSCSHNLAIPNYIIPIKKGGKRKKNNFILYDSAINIHIISYLLTKKEKKGKTLFCFVCMILLLIYTYLPLSPIRLAAFNW